MVTKWGTWILRETVELVESLPYSTTQMSLSEFGVIGLYGAIVCGILLFRDDKVHWWWLLGVTGSLLGILAVEIIY